MAQKILAFTDGLLKQSSVMKPTTSLFTLALAGGALFLSSCDSGKNDSPGEVGSASGGGDKAGSTKIVIKGSDTLGAKMVPQLSEAYKAAGNDVTFEIAAEGSSTAFTALESGDAQIGMSSRGIKEEETNGFIAKGKEIKEWTAGHDMIAIVVNEASGIDNLTLDQVQRIFTGDVTNWSEVGGAAGDISAYTRNTSSGTYKSFQEMAMSKRDYGSGTQKMAGNEQIAQEVAGNPNGIGYVGLAYAGNKGIKVVTIDGVECVPDNMASYPVARSLFLYTIEGETSEAALDFIEWATTDPAAKEIISKVGFIAP